MYCECIPRSIDNKKIAGRTDKKTFALMATIFITHSNDTCKLITTFSITMYYSVLTAYVIILVNFRKF